MCDYYHSFLYNPVFGRFVICFWHISLWFHTLMHMGLTFLQNLISKADFVYSIWIIYCPLFISLIHNLSLTLSFPNWQCKELSPRMGTSNFCWERKVKAFQLLKHPMGFLSSALPFGKCLNITDSHRVTWDSGVSCLIAKMSTRKEAGWLPGGKVGWN